MRIQVLPANLVDQIAAGEVIERPASVVKELVENSLDAGAKRIEIELADGGKQLIRVTDDGRGIEFADLPLAFASHATSKISAIEDLNQIASLGFRGEALASIGAVSRAKILSRTSGVKLGGQIENQGGQCSDVLEAGCPVGTTIEVRDLFFNLPARRKFLKTASTELSQVVDLILRTAIAFDGVEFHVKHENKTVLRIPAELQLIERIQTAFGKEVSDGLIPIEAQNRLGKLTGFLGLPQISRADAGRQFLYVNGRFIRDRALARAIREAYRELLPWDRQPIVFLFLSIRPDLVDQNVHPTKIEVRFQESRELFSFFLNSIRDRLRQANLASSGSTLNPSQERPDREFPVFPATQPQIKVQEAFLSYEAAPSSNRAKTDVRSENLFVATGLAPTRYLQIHNSYLILETADGFEVIDQHALHERVLFEEFKTQSAQGGLAMQRLLVPELVECSRSDVTLIEGRADLLRQLGFEIEAFGEATLAVRGVPARLKRMELTALVEEILALAREESDPTKHNFIEEVLHRAACRAAVMAGDPLTEEEIRSLLSKAGLLGHDQTCPHSRPTRVRFTLDELEKAFHRK